jgi:uncharacterized protein
LTKANAHFSTDLLSALLNEPIAGQGVFWSSVGGKPYPVSLRALSFEKLYPVLDPNYNNHAAPTFAATLRARFESAGALRAGTAAEVDARREHQHNAEPLPLFESVAEPANDGSGTDVLEGVTGHAKHALEGAAEIRRQLEGEGLPWFAVQRFIQDNAVPPHMDEPRQIAYTTVPKVLNAIYGLQNQGWHTFRRDGKTWVKRGPKP